MEIGLNKLKRQLKWRGRKYYGGLIRGLAIGFIIGAGLGAYFSYNIRMSWAFRSLLLAGAVVLSCLGHAVLGSPKKNNKEENAD